MIYTVKTVVGRENIVAEAIASESKRESLNILSVIHPEEIRGYIFVEGELRDIERVLQIVPHVRGVIKKEIRIEEIKRFLQPRKVEVDIDVKDTVEVIGGPFKGEKGRVTRYDKTKREVTIELLEVAIPIPITVSVEFVKLLERGQG